MLAETVATGLPNTSIRLAQTRGVDLYTQHAPRASPLDALVRKLLILKELLISDVDAKPILMCKLAQVVKPQL